jgi:hypothetical protein
MPFKPSGIAARYTPYAAAYERSRDPGPFVKARAKPGRRLKGEELERRKAEIEARYQGTAQTVNNVQ